MNGAGNQAGDFELDVVVELVPAPVDPELMRLRHLLQRIYDTTTNMGADLPEFMDFPRDVTVGALWMIRGLARSGLQP